MTNVAAAPEVSSVDDELLPHILSISKTARQLMTIKLANSEIAVGQDQFLLSFGDGERSTVAALAERLAVRASTVSKMTDILQRKGWVAREANPEDARRVLVHLTEAGCRVRDAVRQIVAEFEAELAAAVGRDTTMLPALVKLDELLVRRLRRLR